MSSKQLADHRHAAIRARPIARETRDRELDFAFAPAQSLHDATARERGW